MEIESAKLIAAGLAVFGFLGVGIGIGNIFSSLLNGIARNPSAKKDLMTPAYIGAAFAEAIALFALIVSMIILFK